MSVKIRAQFHQQSMAVNYFTLKGIKSKSFKLDAKIRREVG